MPESIVRLACVKHAASVRSEPGSNSQVRLASPVARRRNPKSRTPLANLPNRQVHRPHLSDATRQTNFDTSPTPPPAHPFLITTMSINNQIHAQSARSAAYKAQDETMSTAHRHISVLFGTEAGCPSQRSQRRPRRLGSPGPSNADARRLDDNTMAAPGGPRNPNRCIRPQSFDARGGLDDTSPRRGCESPSPCRPANTRESAAPLKPELQAAARVAASFRPNLPPTTWTVSPSPSVPSRIIWANGFCNSRWITRFSGRAP
jgi:hypothetical protein